jgi:hypothetical protein
VKRSFRLSQLKRSAEDLLDECVDVAGPEAHGHSDDNQDSGNLSDSAGSHILTLARLELVDQSVCDCHACSPSLAYENLSGATPSSASSVVSVLDWLVALRAVVSDQGLGRGVLLAEGFVVA